MSSDIVLRTDHLQKHFGSVHAVKDVSLTVKRGEVFGFLGPNGAGKTTTIGMALGLIHPTAGRVEIFGQKVTPGTTTALKQVGSVIGASPALTPYLSARQNLQLVARLHPGVQASRVEEVLALVGLSEVAKRKAGKFSTGMKQRLGLAMALIHKPALLILDEPTNGMDPAGMREVRNLLRALADEGVTVFISSHLLHELEQISDRVAVLNKGSIIAQGPVRELLGGQPVVRVRVASSAEAARLLQTLPDATGIQTNGSYVNVTGPSSEQVVAHLTSQGIIPSEVTTSQADLESLFIELTQAAA